MKTLRIKKDPKKAILLGIFPGMGFLYLENMRYCFIFMFLTIAPLLTISTIGNAAYLSAICLYGLSLYYTYVLATETLKNQETYKKDPYYILCLSFIFDGLGQLALKQNKKAYIMMSTGLTTCLIAWIMLISKYGLLEMLLAPKEEKLFMITNIMITWLIVSIPIKVVGLIDAYYSTYHLYVAKK